MKFDHHSFLAGNRFTASLFHQAASQWVRKFFDDPVQIESVVHEALLEITDRLRAGEEPEPDRLVQWICNCTNNAVRRERTRVRNTDHVGYESRLHGRAANMSQTLRKREELELIEQCLDTCDERARKIIQARVYGDEYREIAMMCKMTEVATRKAISNMRKRLRQDQALRDGQHPFDSSSS